MSDNSHGLRGRTERFWASASRAGSLAAGLWLGIGCHAEPAAAPTLAAPPEPPPESPGPAPEAPGSVSAQDPGPDIHHLGEPGVSPMTCPFPGFPPYPPMAREARVEATVLARCVVETDGSLTCRMLKSHKLFDETILDMLAKARVPVFTKDGIPVRVPCNFPFRFRLR